MPPSSYRLTEKETTSDPPPTWRPPRSRSETPPQFQPDRLFQAARVCSKQNRLDDALLLVRQACAADPERAQYAALHAWLRIQRDGLKPGPAADALLEVFNRAVRERPGDVDVRMYRARALQRLGRSEEAHRDFSFVAKLDRLNVEAARAVRLHDARASSRPSPSEAKTEPPPPEG